MLGFVRELVTSGTLLDLEELQEINAEGVGGGVVEWDEEKIGESSYINNCNCRLQLTLANGGTQVVAVEHVCRLAGTDKSSF